MNAPDKFDHDSLLDEAYDRALRGDQRAGHFLLILLHNSLRETGDATLTDTGRAILSDMLREIIEGKDARDATFTRKGSGNPQWKRQGRDQMLVSEMGWRIKQGMSKRAAAIDVAKKGYFRRDDGEPLGYRRIYNIYDDRKDDPDLLYVFFKDED